MANIELLDRIIAQIEAHPELWDQGTWARPTECGTAYCVAGWVAELTLPLPLAIRNAVIDTEFVDFRDASGAGHDWDTYGREALGLNGDQAEEMFASSNDLTRIKAMRDALAHDPNATLWDIFE